MNEKDSINELSNKTLASYLKKAKEGNDLYHKADHDRKTRNKLFAKDGEYERVEKRAIGSDAAKRSMLKKKSHNTVDAVHKHLEANGYKKDTSGHQVKHIARYIKESDHAKHHVETNSSVSWRYGGIEHHIASKKYGHNLWQSGPAVSAEILHHARFNHEKHSAKHIVNSISDADKKHEKDIHEVMKKIQEDAPTNSIGSGAIASPNNKLLGRKRVKTELIKRWMKKDVIST